MILSKIIKSAQIALFCLSLGCILNACSDDEPSDSGDPSDPADESQMTPEQKRTFETLAGTTWRIISSKDYRSDGSVNDRLERVPKYKGATITFTDQRINAGFYYKILCSSFPGQYAEWILEYNDCSFFMAAITGGMESSDAGSFTSLFGFGKIDMSIYGNQLTLIHKISNSERMEVKYVKVSDSGDGSDSGSGSDGYETPDVDFYDYTPFSATSVKVDYIIYNKSEAGVQSAVIKYGTSTNSMRTASTNIVGMHAIANINGLKANTDYYVKCEVKSKGGNVTTSTTRIRL